MSRPDATRSGFYRTLTMATDLVVLNLLMLICGLLVITGGAGIAAGLAVCLDMIAGRTARPVRQFLATLRRVFPVATVWWLAGLGLVTLLVWEWYVSGQLIWTWLGFGLRTVVLLVALLLGLAGIWFWPLLANRVRLGHPVRPADGLPMARDALFTGLAQLPRTLVAMVLVVTPVAVGLFSPQLGARLIIWFAVIGAALACYLVGLLLRVPLGIGLDDDEVG